MPSEPWNDITTLEGGYPSLGATATESWGEYVQRNLERLIRPPRAKAVASGNLITVNGVGTPFPLDGTEPYDTDGFHNAGSNPERFTIPGGLGGVYHVEAFVGYWDFTPNGTRELAIVKNQVTAVNRTSHVGTNAAAIRQSVSCDVELGDGDTLEMHVVQSSGGNSTIVYLSTEPSFLSIRFVGF